MSAPAPVMHFFHAVPHGDEQFKARVYVLEDDGAEREVMCSGPYPKEKVALAHAREWCAGNGFDYEAHKPPK